MSVLMKDPRHGYRILRMKLQHSSVRRLLAESEFRAVWVLSILSVLLTGCVAERDPATGHWISRPQTRDDVIRQMRERQPGRLPVYPFDERSGGSVGHQRRY